jgi:hypothetical protein
MSYNPWNQYRRQRWSLNYSGSTAACAITYAARPQNPHHWQNHDTFSKSKNNIVIPLTGWLPDAQGFVHIPIGNVNQDLLVAVRAFAALCQHEQNIHPPGSSVGSVLYDATNDRFYYGASGVIRLQTHPVLAGRIGQIPVPAPPPQGVLVNQALPPDVCAEFQALNWALHSGAQEQDIIGWTFRINDMRPLPRCGNCVQTVPNLGQIWTC